MASRLVGTILIAFLVLDESLAQPISAWILQIVRLPGEGRVAAGASVEACEVRGTDGLGRVLFHLIYVESRR